MKFTPPKFKIAPEDDGWEMSFILGLPIFRGYVKFQGCKFSNPRFFAGGTHGKKSLGDYALFLEKQPSEFFQKGAKWFQQKGCQLYQAQYHNQEYYFLDFIFF